MSFQGNFSTSTWLAMGACLQSVLFLALPTRVALLPALVLLLARFSTNLAIAGGVIRNPYLPSGAMMTKMTAPVLDEYGEVSEKGGDKGVVVFIIGASISQYVLLQKQR